MNDGNRELNAKVKVKVHFNLNNRQKNPLNAQKNPSVSYSVLSHWVTKYVNCSYSSFFVLMAFIT